jgi:hypothetical protein
VGSDLSRHDAVGSGPPSLLRRAVQEPCGPGGDGDGVVLRQLAIAQRGGLVARRRRKIASSRNCVTSSRGIDTFRGDLVASLGAAAAKLARELILAGVAATGEVAIARSLVTIGRSLLTVGRSLITIGRSLLTVGRSLITIGRSLITVRCSLIALGGCLVASGSGLVASGSGLVGVRERLVVLERPRRNDNALLRFVAHPVPGIDVPIT